ncbi:MAG: hypothetical protein RL211_1806 [Pseudomonadota bacterium]|jgi:hypothetical protein
MKTLFAAVTLTASVSVSLFAQTLTDLKLEPVQGIAAQSVTAVITLQVENNANCGLKVHWGDGATQEIKVTNKDAIPYKASHTYVKGGDYQVMVEPKRVGTHLKCGGKNITAAYKVAPVVAVPVGAASAPMKSGPTCPDGWKLDAKSVNKKTGAYGCTAKAGTPTPEKKPQCPGDLTYSENSKKGALGCKP